MRNIKVISVKKRAEKKRHQVVLYLNRISSRIYPSIQTFYNVLPKREDLSCLLEVIDPAYSLQIYITVSSQSLPVLLAK